MAKKNIEDVDLYALLDIPITATESEVITVYKMVLMRIIELFIYLVLTTCIYRLKKLTEKKL